MEQKAKSSIRWHSNQNQGDRVSIATCGKNLDLYAAPQLWAQQRLEGIVAPFWKAGHSAELKGTHRWSSSPTWCWPAGAKTLTVGENLFLVIPDEPLDSMLNAKQVQGVGLGGVILGARSGSAPTGESTEIVDLKAWVKNLQNQGVKVGLRPSLVGGDSTCPLDVDYRKKVKSTLEKFLNEVKCDSLVWESRYQEKRYRRKAEEALQLDLLYEELQLLEELKEWVPQLVFLLPFDSDANRQVSHAMALAEIAGFQTQIGVYGEEHIIWERVRERLAPVGLPLVGIIESFKEEKTPTLVHACHRRQAEGAIVAVDALSSLVEKEKKKWEDGEIEQSSKAGKVWAYSTAVAMKCSVEPLMETWKKQVLLCS